MSYCKHHIMTMSTFAWWGTYLCEDPDSMIFVASDAAAFMKRANQFSDEELRTQYFFGNVHILPNHE